MIFLDKSVKVNKYIYTDFFISILINRWPQLREAKNEEILKDKVKMYYKNIKDRYDGDTLYFNTTQLTKWLYLINIYEKSLVGINQDKNLCIALGILLKFLADINLNNHIRSDYLVYAYTRKLPPKTGVQGRKRHVDLTEEEKEFINNLPINSEA